MYFPFFVLHDWGKRSAEARSLHCAVLPKSRNSHCKRNYNKEFLINMHTPSSVIPPTIALLSQQAKKQFLVSTCQTADDDAIVKTRKKGFRETAKFSKSLGIPYFKPISVLF